MSQFPEVTSTDETVEVIAAPAELDGLVDRFDSVDQSAGDDSGSGQGKSTSSLVTVVIAFVANLLVALAKTVAAGLTGSASLVAEAAHSWADTGNEVFLLIAERRSERAADETHPLGYGREAYVWSLFAAMGIFVAGAAVSIMHGVSELRDPSPASDFTIGYIVLGVSFLLEGTSFLQSARQARREAGGLGRDLVEHVLATSDPTLRAVFAEDAAALVGLVIAGLALLAHQLSGSPVPDAIGSILVGLLLAVVALILINRNRGFLVGQMADERLRSAVIEALLDLPEVDRVTYLRLDVVGPRKLYLVADIDLAGDEVEHRIAVRLRDMEARLCRSTAIVAATLSLSSPDEPSLVIAS